MTLTREPHKTDTLVYHHENGHSPIYVVMSEIEGKYDLALPWEPTVPVLRGVDAQMVEPVFDS